MPLLLASPAIPPGGEIPSQYTCDGANISPPLKWSGLPDGTKSLVLVVQDPDAPSGVFRHWAVFDIPAGSRGLDAGYSPNRPAKGLREVRLDFGKPSYDGPVRPRDMGPTITTSASLRSAGRLSILGRRRPPRTR